MKITKQSLVGLGSLLFMLLTGNNLSGQIKGDVKIGAYYFDGWTGRTYHISEKLKTQYKSRQPIWGWVTSTEESMTEQINLASEYGLSFFNFCWYYTAAHGREITKDPKNNALNLFMGAENTNKMEFCITVVNHGDHYTIRKEHWEIATDYWIRLFKQPNYLKADGKPLISFFNLAPLVKTFGNMDNVKAAFQRFREKAMEAGLEGISIAVCLDPSNEQVVGFAKVCGFDIITGYNYANIGFKQSRKTSSLKRLQKKEKELWGKAESAGLPFIPVATLNWDQRAWEDVNPQLVGAKRYKGFSKISVKNSVKGIKNWIISNGEYTTVEKIGFLYAWNEYGEGAWLTPSAELGNGLLIGVKEGLGQN